MKLKIISLLFFLTALLNFSCNTTEPPVNNNTLRLIVEDASCTEAWIKVSSNSCDEIIITKEDTPIAQISNLCSKDTLIVIDSLLPNQSYTFQAVVSHGGNITSGSEKVTVKTLDTTSHNFTWQTFTFGDHSNSILRDVVVIDENNIYAVGTIYLNDSLGQPDPNPFAIAHWNGNNWSFIRLYYKSPLGGEFVLSNISGIHYNNSSEIWLSAGSIFFWDRISTHAQLVFSRLDLPHPNSTIEKIWGISNFNFWGVGHSGSIVRYDGNQWTFMESGTTVDLLDIWGSEDGTVWACGYNSEDAFTVLLRHDGIQWNKVYEGSPDNQNNNEFIGPTSGVWTNSKFFTYVASWGKIYKQPNNNTLDIKRITQNFSDVAFSMRGTNHNNIFIAGQHGLVGHFNGVTYQEITELKNEDEYLLKIDVKNNTAAAVGYNYQGFTGSTAAIHIINHNK
jgi:hypothetical protein